MEKNVETLVSTWSDEDQSALDDIEKRSRQGFKAGRTLRGYNFPSEFPPSAAEYAYDHMEPKEGDVFVASYPKTGTTWTAEIIRRILYEDEKTYMLSLNIPFAFKFIEIAPNEKFAFFHKFPFKRRLMYTHLAGPLVNIETIRKAKAKICYVLRNPKDQMVSYHKFIQRIPPGQVEPVKSMTQSGWDKYFEHVVAGDLPMVSKPNEWYPEHILSWYKHRDNKTVCFVYYEDLKQDLQGQIKLLAEFLNVPLSDERVVEIAEACTFDNMKENFLKKSKNPNFATNIMRKGGVGGWKDYFTVSQSERIDAIMEEKLKDTDIKFTYEL